MSTSREEDIVAIRKNGDLLYVSCKFAWCKNITLLWEKTLEEVDRLQNLQLAFNIPKEKITKILVTTIEPIIWFRIVLMGYMSQIWQVLMIYSPALRLVYSIYNQNCNNSLTQALNSWINASFINRFNIA